MAMMVMHNAGAQLSLGELNRNSNKAGKTLAVLSSGQKINSAGDDASGYSISEQMRSKIRALEQDVQNVQNGSAMLKTAEGGIQCIVDELRDIKELAIDAANDSNTDDDRRVMQKVLEQKLANINDLAVSTNYNGKRLIDGSYARYHIHVPKEKNDIDYDSSAFKNVPEPKNPAEFVREDANTLRITSKGIFTLPTDLTSDTTIYVSTSEPVEFVQADPSTALRNVRIVVENDNANVWLRDVNISNSIATQS